MEEYFQRGDMPMVDSPDLSEYPEEARGVLDAVCRVFNLTPPKKNRRKGSSFSLWIQSARELADACRPLEAVDVLKEVRRDLTLALHKGNGYTVAGPQSLVNVARAKVGQRMPVHKKSEDEPLEIGRF